MHGPGDGFTATRTRVSKWTFAATRASGGHAAQALRL